MVCMDKLLFRKICPGQIFIKLLHLFLAAKLLGNLINPGKYFLGRSPLLDLTLNDKPLSIKLILAIQPLLNIAQQKIRLVKTISFHQKDAKADLLRFILSIDEINRVINILTVF